MKTLEVDAALGAAHCVFIDTSPIIAFYSTAETAHPVASRLFERVADADDPLLAYIAMVSASELLIRPIRAADH